MRTKIPRGSVFQRSYKGRDGKVRLTRTWFVKYYVAGKAIVLPADTEDYDEAERFLLKRRAAAADQPISDIPERVRMAQLFDLMYEQYKKRERRTTYDLQCQIRPADKDHEEPGPLRAWFGAMKAKDVTSSVIEKYIKHRQGAKRAASNGTINRELAIVRRALNLGAEQDPPLVMRVPKFEMLVPADPRQGTVPHDRYLGLRTTLPDYARLALVIGYHTGLRKGVVLRILRAEVNLTKRIIVLPGRIANNKGRPRVVPIYGDMVAEIEMALAVKTDSPFLIQRHGKPVADFEKVWTAACELAGIPEALFHDLRRTALTNMIEAGYSEKEAMEFSGHKTRAVFDRYHIVSERRVREMASKMEAHLKGKEVAATEEKSLN